MTEPAAFSDHQHLLSPNATAPPQSSASSIYSVQTIRRAGGSAEPVGGPSFQSIDAISVADTSSILDRQSIAESTRPQQPQPYRGFPSREVYLDALREWVEEKQYLQLETGLHGWYGHKTMQTYIDKPGGGLGISERRREKKAEKARRKSEAAEQNDGGEVTKDLSRTARFARRFTVTGTGKTG